MKRLLPVLLVLVLVAGGVAVLVKPAAVEGRIYSIAEVRAGVRQQPRQWVGRTVWVVGKTATVGSSYSGPLGPGAGIPRTMDPLYPPPKVAVRIEIVPSTYSFMTRQDVRTVRDRFVLAPHLGPENPIQVLVSHVPFAGTFFHLRPLSGETRLMMARYYRITLSPAQSRSCRPLYDSTCFDALLDDLHS